MTQAGMGKAGRGTLAATMVAALMMVFSASAAAQPLSFNFDSALTQASGWRVSQDNGGNLDPAQWIANGGNPATGGHIRGTDTLSDTNCLTAPPNDTPCNILYFEGPDLSGGYLANYGGTASFDLRSNVSPAFASTILILGPTGYLEGLVPTTVGANIWRNYSISLVEGSSWDYCDLNTNTCAPASQATFKAALAQGIRVSIQGDYGPLNAGAGNYDLDNVLLTDGPVPPPVPTPTVVTPTKKKKCKKKKRGRAFSAKKKCKKKKRVLASHADLGS